MVMTAYQRENGSVVLEHRKQLVSDHSELGDLMCERIIDTRLQVLHVNGRRRGAGKTQKVKKACFYTAQYPVNWTAQSILAMQQLRNDYSLTFPPLSIKQGRQWREQKCPIFEMVAKRDSNQGSLDCESGILPLSYRAPQKETVENFLIYM